MHPCSHCGTNLPDEAKFCLKCGAPVIPPEPEVPGEAGPTPPPDGPPPELDFIQPALAGGAFLGLLSSLPFIAAGNCLCCMWVLGGGSMATMLLTKQQPLRKITRGDGAFAGVLSGLFGAIIATIVSIPVKVISRSFLESQQPAIDKMFENLPEIQGPIRELFMRVMSTEISITTVLFTFISNLFVYALFAMVGGIITVEILERRKAAALPPPRPD